MSSKLRIRVFNCKMQLLKQLQVICKRLQILKYKGRECACVHKGLVMRVGEIFMEEVD